MPAGRAVWFDVAQRLAANGVAEPVLWLGDGVHDAAAKIAFPDADVVSFKAINFKRRVPATAYNGQFAAFWTSAALHDARDHAIKMMDRSERLGPTSGPEREAYFAELCFWAMERISTTKAQVLVMAENPHSAPSYILHAIARFAGLKVLVFSSWPLAPIVTLRRSLTPPDLDIRTLNLTSEQDRASLLANFETVVTEYIAGFNDPQKYGFIPRYMQMQAGRDPLAGKMAQLAKAIKSSVRLLKPRMAYAAIVKTRLHRAFLQRAETTIPDGPYVYFPLHYEPERTTNPDGGVFHDQLRVLSRLRALVPPSIAICVKEHPSQFNERLIGHQGRSARFYDAVRAVSGVHLLAETVPSSQLILCAQAVATVTGTVALEAAVLGRPALVFGGAWFDGCPNVTRYTDDLDWDSFRNQSLETPEVIGDWLKAQLAACGLPACVNPSNQKYFARYYQHTTRAVREAPILAEAIAAALALD